MAVDRETAQLAEAFRSLRSTIKFAASERAMRSVLVVDLDRDQPSGVAEGLTRAFADGGDRCVLIDLRADAGSGPGIAEVLSGRAAIGDVVQAPATGAVVVLGPGSDFSADLLASDRFPEIVDALGESGAFTVIASRSSPASADALAIAPRVDATVLVVSQGRTRRGRAMDAREALERVGAHILGVVMVNERRRWYW